MKVHGACHCGAITYEADVQPDTVNICHCHDCQTLTGSAFRANISTAADKFKILTGTPRPYVKVAESGAKRVHAFCETCGGPIYSSAVENPKTYSLRVGALRERDQLGMPARQIWTKRRLRWVPKISDVPAVEGQP